MRRNAGIFFRPASTCPTVTAPRLFWDRSMSSVLGETKSVCHPERVDRAVNPVVLPPATCGQGTMQAGLTSLKTTCGQLAERLGIMHHYTPRSAKLIDQAILRWSGFALRLRWFNFTGACRDYVRVISLMPSLAAQQSSLVYNARHLCALENAFNRCGYAMYVTMLSDSRIAHLHSVRYGSWPIRKQSDATCW